jgi:hypothetical protein
MSAYFSIFPLFDALFSRTVQFNVLKYVSLFVSYNLFLFSQEVKFSVSK